MAKKVKRIRWENHPSITVVGGKPRLKVFEEYFVEEDLPKYKKISEEEAKSDSGINAANIVVGTADAADAAGNGWLEGEGVPARVSDATAAREAKWARNRYIRLRLGTDSSSQIDRRGGFRAAVRAAKSWIKNKRPPSDGVSVEETFRLAKEDELHVTTEELLRSRAIAVSLVNRFKQTCQFGMAKKVEDHLNVLAAKLALAQRDMCRYLTEEQAVEFITKAERGVQVEFLRYYPEVIPNDVAVKLAQCNLAMLFDNYVVMYYSKDVKPARLLEEEIDEEERHKRRDPILFGTIRGSRDLYFVADWVYKDDDLTLATVEKAIGTLPTLKDEQIADSQYRIEELLNDVRLDVDRSIAEAKDRGNFIELEPAPTPPASPRQDGGGAPSQP